MKTLTAAAFTAGFLSTACFAQDMPVPKIFRGVEGQKGQYKVEFLEGAAAGRAPTMTVCTDNLLKDSTAAKGKARSESSVCKERTSTVTIKRDGKTMLMTVESTGPRGPQTMKMRYTHLGPCRRGRGARQVRPARGVRAAHARDAGAVVGDV